VKSKLLNEELQLFVLNNFSRLIKCWRFGVLTDLMINTQTF